MASLRNLVIFSFAALLAACAGPGTTVKDSLDTYLWVVTASGGTIEGIGDDTGTEVLTVTLTGVSDLATQFTDRPARKAYVLSMSDFVNHWKPWFTDDPPNVVLSYLAPGEATPHAAVLAMDAPAFDAAADSLTFTAHHLHRQPDPHPDVVEQVTMTRRPLPKTFSAASLFIDSASDQAIDTPASPQPSLANADPATTGTTTPPVTSSGVASPSAGAVTQDADQLVVNGCVIGPGTSCPGEWLMGADLRGADLRGANLQGTHLGHAVLAGANLTGANLIGLDADGVDMHGANLTGANLMYAELYSADAHGAVLRGAQLSVAEMQLADLHGADLQGAMLQQAQLSGADLRGANLTSANVIYAVLVGFGEIDAANLAGAALTDTDFSHTDLAGVIWSDGRVCQDESYGECR